jgi:hypothetical protein
MDKNAAGPSAGTSVAVCCPVWFLTGCWFGQVTVGAWLLTLTLHSRWLLKSLVSLAVRRLCVLNMNAKLPAIWLGENRIGMHAGRAANGAPLLCGHEASMLQWRHVLRVSRFCRLSMTCTCLGFVLGRGTSQHVSGGFPGVLETSRFAVVGSRWSVCGGWFAVVGLRWSVRDRGGRAHDCLSWANVDAA